MVLPKESMDNQIRFADRFEGVTGSEIRKIFSLLSDPQIISLAGGNPSPRAFPAEELAELSRELIAGSGSYVLQYGETKGDRELLGILKERDARLFGENDDIIITSGASQGIEMFARSLLNEGDSMLVESPTFLGALQTFRMTRANIRAVKMEHDGVDIACLEEAIEGQGNKPKFFYIVPTFQNPSGLTTSEQKRKEIYALCKRHGVLILEDDPYAALRYNGRPQKSIKAFDNSGIVCRLMSFSKTISPGLRVGYAIADKEVIAKINLLKQGQDVCTSCLSQTLVRKYLESGLYEGHVKKLVELYRTQRDAMLSAIETHFPAEVRYMQPEGGLFVWVTLPEGMDSGRLFERCIEQKVAFVPGSPFFAEGGHKNTLRLNFSMPTVSDIRTGVARIGKIISEYD